MVELGWCQHAGMGMAELSHAEIAAWCQLMQTELEPWEVQAIRATSRAYCQQGSSKDQREPNFDQDAPKEQVSAIRALAAALNKTQTEPKEK